MSSKKVNTYDRSIHGCCKLKKLYIERLFINLASVSFSIRLYGGNHYLIGSKKNGTNQHHLVDRSLNETKLGMVVTNFIIQVY